MDLTTQARVLAHLEAGRENITNASTLALISTLVTQYSAMAERLMGRSVQTTSRTEYHDVYSGQSVFALRAYPVTSVTSIYHDTTRTWSTGEIDSGNYYLDLTNGLLVIDGQTLPPAVGSLRCIYTGGMAASAATFVTAYPDVAGAIDLQVVYHWQRRLQLGGMSMQAGTGAVAFSGGLDWLPEAKKVLLSHKRILCG